MKTLPKRLENAVTKLYNAFHANELEAANCRKCAVGNLCDNSGDWTNHFSIGSENRVSGTFDNKTGYSASELTDIECLFIGGETAEQRRSYGYRKFTNWKGATKDQQFKGLCAVVKYLCELDGVENIMEIQSLFEFDENKKPINQLTF